MKKIVLTFFRITFIGEIFTSYIIISNVSAYDVTDVKIKVELQTANQRETLLQIDAGPMSAQGSSSLDSHDYLVQHEVKEKGTHM